MIGDIVYRTSRPLLFALDPEAAHGLTLSALRLGLGGGSGPVTSARLKVQAFGLDFPNPVGLAAGADKNADVPDAMLALGFGFVEAGTVTPRPQAGNPRPRIFRLVEDQALVNRLGFNNAGLAAARERLIARVKRPGIVGINVGANKDSTDRIADYVMALEALAPFARYVTVNISSPNTPGLRGLQNRDELEQLLARVTAARDALPERKPVLLKVAPDLDAGAIESIAMIALDSGIDGLIVSNTTVARPEHLRSAHRGEQGGLSGAPLFPASTAVLKTFARHLAGRLPLVGVGGIMSAADAYAKIRAGATLVQAYTGMVYGGPGFARRIAEGLDALLARDGYARVADAVGRDV